MLEKGWIVKRTKENKTKETHVFDFKVSYSMTYKELE